MTYDLKELFMLKHEELCAEYMEAHPSATEQEAYDATADQAYGRMQDAYADMIDYARAMRK